MARASNSPVFKWYFAAIGLITVAAIAIIASVISSSTDPAEQVSKSLSQQTPSAGTRVCGQPVLRSPYTYNGRPGPYQSGTAGLPTYGTRHSDFPRATAGMVLPPEEKDYQAWQLRPNTVYYLEPGIHVSGIQANKNDAFVGGRAKGKTTILSGDYRPDEGFAIDSNSTVGNQPGVTIEYLTIERYMPDVNAAAINQEANTDWTVRYNTITLNVPGAGMIAGANNIIKSNCMTQNGQYGFQSTDVVGFSVDSITGGPYNVTVENNEISYNDTCDLEGTINNPAAGLHNYNPVPPRYRNSHCGHVTGDGNQGGFKLWATNGVTIKDNYIHHNWGAGGWADTNNANTTWIGNTITDNDAGGIDEETSYNFSITHNYLARNDIFDGLGNTHFPNPAIYVSESGSDTTFGGIPACPEPSCAGQGAYPKQSVISHNTLVDNGGSIFLWQNSDRYCGDSFDPACTLVRGPHSGRFTISACRAHLPSSGIDTTTFVGKQTGSPAENWYDGCMWKTQNVSITHNKIYFNPAKIPYCNKTAWPACGAGGMFSEYGGPSGPGGWVVPTDITFFQNNHWSDNVYIGPSTFYAWNQGNGENPVSWADWTGQVSDGDKCSSAGERHSGYCTGPFGQDAGSRYNKNPAATVNAGTP
jgi:Right handed beta helix region